MSWMKALSGGGDSGAELTMPSEEEVTSFNSRSLSQPPTHRRAETLKEPWIPAPGRTTKARSQTISANPDVFAQVESSSVTSIEIPNSATKSLVNLNPGNSKADATERRRHSSRSKKSRSKGDRKMSGFTLETKDSLIDVTACLNKRREEVFLLWEKHVLKCDAALLTELENANTLAIESTNDVKDLRSMIDKLKKKPGTLSEADANSLDVLRCRILSKLKLFETSYDYIQKRLQSREPSQSRKSRSPATPTAHHIPDDVDSRPFMSLKSASSPDLKQRISTAPSDIKIEDISEEEPENEADGDNRDHPLVVEGLKPSVFSLKDFKLQNKHSNLFGHNSESDRGRLSNQKKSFNERENGNATFVIDSIYYRDKVRSLHKKLMDQETKYDEMKRQMKRIESQNDYDIRLLKSNMKAQLEELSHIPEMMEFTEGKLNESLNAKFAIENSLQMKTKELSILTSEVEKLRKDLEMTQAKVRAAEVKEVSLSQKAEMLETENKELRMELWNKTQLLKSIELKAHEERIKIQEKEERASVEVQTTSGNENHKLLMLEDKIIELEAELEKAQKETLAMRRAKNDVATRMNRRVDELMDTLEQTRAKNRSLQNQISLIKAKYFQLFAPHTTSDNVNAFPEMSRVIAETLEHHHL